MHDSRILLAHHDALKKKEAALRTLVLASALLFGSLSLPSQADAARPRHHSTADPHNLESNGPSVRELDGVPFSAIDPFHFPDEKDASSVRLR